MPVRLRHKSYSSFTGYFPSDKNKLAIHYESTIERDLLFYLEFALDVISYEEQPMVIEYSIENDFDKKGNIRIHFYIPDFRSNCKSGPKIYECKPESKVDNEHSQGQIIAGERWSKENVHEFILVTDKSLRTGNALYNQRLCWRYRNLEVPRLVVREILGHLHQAQISEFEEICDLIVSKFREYPIPHPFVYALIWQHLLAIDIQEKLSPTSQLWLTEKESTDVITSNTD